jgi:hypothetical protein
MTYDPRLRSLKDVEMSVRSLHCLLNIGCSALGDVTIMSVNDLRKVDNLGIRTLNEIKEVLIEHGLEPARQDYFAGADRAWILSLKEIETFRATWKPLPKPKVPSPQELFDTRVAVAIFDIGKALQELARAFEARGRGV